MDTQGLPHAIGITTANVTNRSGMLDTLRRCFPNLNSEKGPLSDGGYTGDAFAQTILQEVGLDATVQLAKRNELHTFKVIPKRWGGGAFIRLAG